MFGTQRTRSAGIKVAAAHQQAVQENADVDICRMWQLESSVVRRFQQIVWHVRVRLAAWHFMCALSLTLGDGTPWPRSGELCCWKEYCAVPPAGYNA